MSIVVINIITTTHKHAHNTLHQLAETALADERVLSGDRLALQRRVLRLGKPPRRWKQPAWATGALWEPPEVVVEGRPLNSVTGAAMGFPHMFWCTFPREHASKQESKASFMDGTMPSAQWNSWRCSIMHSHSMADGQVRAVVVCAHLCAPQERHGTQYAGLHSEGGIWATLFGLLFWDIVFTDAPDVLRTPYQTAPLDLHTLQFYAPRKVWGCVWGLCRVLCRISAAHLCVHMQLLVDARLEEIATGDVGDLLSSAWQAHCGVLCRGVSWDRHTLLELQTIARACGGRMLAAVCGLLAREDVGGTGMGIGEKVCIVDASHRVLPFPGGMPDLLLYRTAQPAGAKLVEVKGPRDRLSDTQRAWMRALQQAGMV